MTPNAAEILKAKVVKIDNFQSTFVLQSNLWWTADFQLESNQRFHIRRDETGYLYTPDAGHNLLPELKEIHWKKYKMGFGDRRCGLDTAFILKNGTIEDYKAYEKILTPTVMKGQERPYPCYNYVPMLITAFEIGYAYRQKIKIDRMAKQADQNLADALALRKLTNNLREYC